MQHSISWFEIPTTDIDRATRFYEAVFQCALVPMDFPNIRMRMFPVDNPQEGISGALVHSGDFHLPSATHGPLVYLNANPDVQPFLDRVQAAGGQVLVPKTLISEDIGHMGVFLDSEGNRIALHSIPS